MGDGRKKSFDDLFAEATGGGTDSFDAQFAAATADAPPQVGATLEGLDAERAAAEQRADQARFRPLASLKPGVDYQTTSAPSAGRDFWEKAHDALLRGSNALLAGYGDEAVGALAGPDARERLRRRLANIKEEEPTAALVGDVGGGLAQGALAAFAAGPAAAASMRALPLAGRVAAGSGFGAEWAALNASGYADDGDRLQAAADAAPIGAALGGAGELVGAGAQAAGRAVQRFAPAFQRTADAQLLRQGGAMKADLDRMADTGGLAKYAEGARRLGIGGTMKSLDDWASDATRLAGDPTASPAIPGALNQAREAIVARAGGAGVDPQALGNRLGGLLPQYPAGPGTSAMRGAVTDAASEARAMAPAGQTAPFADVNRVRQLWGEGTNFAQGSPQAGIRKNVYGALNEELESTLSAADPGAGEKWRQLGRDEQVAITLRDIAKDRQRGLASNRVMSPTDYIAAGGGGFIGALGGPGGSAGGAALGLAANKLVRGREHGMLSAAAGGLASAARSGAGLPAVGVGSSVAGQTGAMFAGQREGTTASMLPQVALDMVAAGGDELGPYKSQFFEAAASPDTGAVSALITRLTMSDPAFRETTLKQLRELAQRGR